MRQFELMRTADPSGISGTGVVAEGVKFADGTCAMRWRTRHRSTCLYEDIDTLREIHGHNGATEVVWISDVFCRGRNDAIQDSCENAPFASTGGLDKREAMTAPSYINAEHADEYLRGYRAGALAMHGPGWETATFGWHPALVINGPAQ